MTGLETTHALQRKSASYETALGYRWVAPIVIAHCVRGVSHRSTHGRAAFCPVARV